MNSRNLEAMALARMSDLAYRQEDYPRAEAVFKQALEIFKDTGIMDAVVWITRMLGCVAFHRGQTAYARQLFLESQSLGARLYYRDQIGDPGGDLSFVVWTGVIADSLGQPAVAARLLGAVQAVLETFFKPLDRVDLIEYEHLTGKLRLALDETAFTAAWNEGRQLTLTQALNEALAYGKSIA
jgi:hypothetical protein